MKTIKEVINKVQLVDGVFTASEASDIVSNLIEEKINFHKLHRLSLSEGNINSDTGYDDSRVIELTADRKELKQLCREARLTGKKIKINGILEIEVID
ncbi:hypothetical protein [Nonlabens sp.]|uniref:hypothetical protein n=1 Tax=Nonlabens sp. TaxID=1888209 RepID=UPI001BD1AFDB|nr:hypothetical protein [Nonlabens sp.]